MKNSMVLVGLAGVIGFIACGGNDKANYVDPSVTPAGSSGKTSRSGNGSTEDGGEGGAGTAGSVTRGGTGGSVAKPVEGGEGGIGEGGNAGAGGEAPGEPPTVTILSPDAVTDPLDGKVLVADSVDVVCKAEPGLTLDASPVDPTSVKIAVLDTNGGVVSEKAAGLTANADEYSATLPLTAVSTGKISLRCNAESTTHALGTDQRDSLADRGPKITLTAPPTNAKLALNDAVKITFTALPQPLGESDAQAEVASVGLSINGVKWPTVPVNGSPDSYEATVQFTDAAFMTKPNGSTTIGITATNKRNPIAATQLSTSSVFVDGSGPVIQVTSPGDKALVGGNVTLTFTATDAGSGVNQDSVSVSLNGVVHPFDLTKGWVQTGDSFTYTFDSRTVTGPQDSQITVTIAAKDNVKNAATPEQITLFLDNQGPQVDLDPANVRTVSPQGECSVSFDPLGTSAANDLSKGSGDDFLRVLVWEQTNRLQGSLALPHFAGTDNTSVSLYLANPSDATKLLVSSKTPGTGTCDAIGGGHAIGLDAVAGSGLPWYGAEGAAAPATGQLCTTPPGSKPSLLCNAKSDLWQVIVHSEGNLVEPAVYALGPAPNTNECTGIAWNYLPFVNEDGWVCFGAKATDKVGNVGVSPALRVCIDKNPSDGLVPPCASSTTDAPKCTDGCTAPARGGGRIVSLQ
jgi:hypothetical protein